MSNNSHTWQALNPSCFEEVIRFFTSNTHFRKDESNTYKGKYSHYVLPVKKQTE